jgi:glycosyltransferase involved in cell wall biosynthesis
MTDAQPTLFMYVGNLEKYQGIDLLLEAFAEHFRTRRADRLVVVGGTPEDVRRHRAWLRTAGLEEAVEFRGHQPVSCLAQFLLEADVLVSPRIKGTNTPMKIYSYLSAGKPILATDLLTHTQILTPEVAVLVRPDPEGMAYGMGWMSAHPAERAAMGAKGRELLATRYSRTNYEAGIDQICAHLETAVAARRATR